jgi:hypothetical protein
LSKKVAVITGSLAQVQQEIVLYLYAAIHNVVKSQRIKELANKDNLPLQIIDVYMLY